MISKIMSRRMRTAFVGGGVLAFTAAASIFVAEPAYAAEDKKDKDKPASAPCGATARACVDLDTQKAWLMSGGKVTHGPFKVASGGKGRETPTGTFSVVKKNKDHKSQEFPLPNGDPAPMPNAVFFTGGGVAFHGGKLSTPSAGCVRLGAPNDALFFNTLNVGDQVQVKQSRNGKGGFYKVNKLKPPTKKQEKARLANLQEARKAQAAKRAGVPYTPPKKDDDKKKDDKKKSDSKKKDDKSDKKDKKNQGNE